MRDSGFSQNMKVVKQCVQTKYSNSESLTNLINKNGGKWTLTEKCVILASPQLVLLIKCDGCVKLIQINSVTVDLPKKII